MGNSAVVNILADVGTVHPHVHGELIRSLCIENSLPGSSPRAWGTQTGDVVAPHLDRFIPTCMGNSLEFLYGTWKTTSWIP